MHDAEHHACSEQDEFDAHTGQYTLSRVDVCCGGHGRKCTDRADVFSLAPTMIVEMHELPGMLPIQATTGQGGVLLNAGRASNRIRPIEASRYRSRRRARDGASVEFSGAGVAATPRRSLP